MHRVMCTKCRVITKRTDLQHRLLSLNPTFDQLLNNLSSSASTHPILNNSLSTTSAASERGQMEPDDPLATPLELLTSSPTSTITASLRPDGDIQLSTEAYSEFKIPECLSCGGILKPNVVFFGQLPPLCSVVFTLHCIHIWI
jgi:hypothetical protein